MVVEAYNFSRFGGTAAAPLPERATHEPARTDHLRPDHPARHLGFLFAAHGWQKFNEFTIAGTQAAFAKMGVPAAEVAAPVVAILELVGGVALILGVLTRVFAALLALDMLGALFLVHASAGVFVGNRRLRAGPAPGGRSPGRGPRRRRPRLRGQGTLRPQRLETARPRLGQHPNRAALLAGVPGGRSPRGGRPPSCADLWAPGYGVPDSDCVAGPRPLPGRSVNLQHERDRAQCRDPALPGGPHRRGPQRLGRRRHRAGVGGQGGLRRRRRLGKVLLRDSLCGEHPLRGSGQQRRHGGGQSHHRLHRAVIDAHPHRGVLGRSEGRTGHHAQPVHGDLRGRGRGRQAHPRSAV